jgi:hypothetical protein
LILHRSGSPAAKAGDASIAAVMNKPARAERFIGYLLAQKGSTLLAFKGCQRHH